MAEKTANEMKPGEKMVFKSRMEPIPMVIDFADGTKIELTLLANAPLTLTVGTTAPTITLNQSDKKLGDLRVVE